MRISAFYCRSAESNPAIAGRIISASIGLVAAGYCAASPTPAPENRSPECTVWAREQSFARSVADHDASAFGKHIAKDAVFDVGSANPAHGRDVIARQWKDIIAGKGIRPRWYPTRVALSARGDLAWSTGPVLIENPGATAKERYQLGKFRSVWRKEADGVWRVLFDDGGNPIAVTDKEARAFDNGKRDCPAAR